MKAAGISSFFAKSLAQRPKPRFVQAAIALLLSILGLALASPPAFAAPAFAEPGPLATDSGNVMLEWTADGPVTLEMAARADFSDAEPLYRGGYSAYFLSGLEDGGYWLRLRAADGALSAPLRLDVAHQSLSRALWLMLAGALTSLAIVATILRGARE